MQAKTPDPKQDLAPLIGEWAMVMTPPGADPIDAGAKVRFEWLPGEKFVLERWEVPAPGAPDGLAVIGYDEGRGSYLQHYFDSRGVARVYEMTIGDRAWNLARTEADFSPLDFKQRWTSEISADGKEIAGRWELCQDGETWEHDFDLTYKKL